MSMFDGNVFSNALGMIVSLTVILPAGSKYGTPDGDMPVLTLLHGLSDNRSAWVRRTKVDLYAEQAGLAVVIPEVQRSFYTDMAYGLDYYTYVSEELPRLCRQMVRLSDRREDNFVAGLSMGGYGALKLAFQHPERYAAAACFSGAVDAQSRYDLLPEKERISINKDRLADDCNLFLLAEGLKEKGPAPRLYMTCGRSDFMYEDNQRFHHHMESLGIEHTYEEWDGGHDWFFWDESIRRAIPFLLEEKNAD